MTVREVLSSLGIPTAVTHQDSAPAMPAGDGQFPFDPVVLPDSVMRSGMPNMI